MNSKSMENWLQFFVRSADIPFTVQDALVDLAAHKVYATEEEVYHFLEDSPVVLPVSDTQFVSRSLFFGNAVFSIKPSRYEVEHGILIVGDRCMPFADPELPVEEFVFVWGKKYLKQKVAVLPAQEVMRHYGLYGEEYAVQYIAMDPCNEDVDFASYDFMLPPKVSLTVIDMGDVYKKSRFEYGDRLLVTTISWMDSIFRIEPLCERKDNPFVKTETEELRDQWYENLERALLLGFEEFGPCRSIEEQLAYVCMFAQESLFVRECGSISEYLENSKVVEIQEYGVESRLWKAGEAIDILSDLPVLDEEPDELRNLLGFSMQGIVFGSYVKDALYLQEKDASQIFGRMVLEPTVLEEKSKKLIQLHLKKLYNVIRQSYNWFSDVHVGEVRHRALLLYSKLLHLASEMNVSRIPGSKLPQQELIIFTQLVGHTTRLIEALEQEGDIDEKEYTASLMSLEGMEYSFEDIEGVLTGAIERYRKQGFSIIE